MHALFCYKTDLPHEFWNLMPPKVPVWGNFAMFRNPLTLPQSKFDLYKLLHYLSMTRIKVNRIKTNLILWPGITSIEEQRPYCCNWRLSIIQAVTKPNGHYFLSTFIDLSIITPKVHWLDSVPILWHKVFGPGNSAWHVSPELFHLYIVHSLKWKTFLLQHPRHKFVW